MTCVLKKNSNFRLSIIAMVTYVLIERKIDERCHSGTLDPHQMTSKQSKPIGPKSRQNNPTCSTNQYGQTEDQRLDHDIDFFTPVLDICRATDLI